MANMVGTERSNIVAIANAVRNRTGESGDLTIGEIISGINGIEGGENLDAEISSQNAIIAEQDAKIAELAEVLAGKASGSGGGNNTVKVTIVGDGLACYLDENKAVQCPADGEMVTANVFGGAIFATTIYDISGNYMRINQLGAIFFNDGGYVSCYHGGSAN